MRGPCSMSIAEMVDVPAHAFPLYVLHQTTRPPHERVCSPRLCVSIQIDFFPYKYCPGGWRATNPLMGGPCRLPFIASGISSLFGGVSLSPIGRPCPPDCARQSIVVPTRCTQGSVMAEANGSTVVPECLARRTICQKSFYVCMEYCSNNLHLQKKPYIRGGTLT
ncbi:hypothetical protein GQ44DRAFT_68438 [Phaeosphaeriaceae sp. PMI808]|nr:hypothetical protein GQ44DRAFT_68438 [Phaeosphaeriaceae sp. PMI808]